MADALSLLLRQLDFSAQVFFREAYCGRWAVDTSGSTHVPFHLVASGSAWLHHTETPTALLEGDLVVFPSDSPHLLSGSAQTPDAADVNQLPLPPSAGDETRLICGYFKLDRRAAQPLLRSLPTTMVAHLGTASDAGTRELTAWWIREATAEQLGSDLAVDRLAELVFMQLLRAESAAGRVKGLVVALGHPRIGPVLAAIHENPGADHQLREMARRAQLSESAFATRFKAVVGMRPGEYVKQWRMNTAARLLRDTHQSIASIAAGSGYVSEVAFRKAFQKFFLEPPGKYRRRQRTLAIERP